MIRILAVCAVAVGLAGCGTASAGHAGTPPSGTWIAHGVVVEQNLPYDEPPGTTFERAWVFRRRCTFAGVCGLTLVRQAKYGTELAQVTRSGDGYDATFTIRDDSCIRGRAAIVHRHFRIRLDAGGRHLRAVETEDGAYPGCGTNGATARAGGRLIWTATRGRAPATPPADAGPTGLPA